MQKLNCDFFDFELDALFRCIDIKKDNKIDYLEWLEVVC